MKWFNALIALIFVFLLQFSSAQLIDYQYRSDKNPHYWKNNHPIAGYWQQDVHYKMKVNLIDSLDKIEVSDYQLVYYNNSPDSLDCLYFHLYQNAFQPNSYMQNLYEANGQKVTFGHYEAQGLGTTFDNLKVNGKITKTSLDNTILKVFLNEKLLPGDSLKVEMSFNTYFDKGSLRRRMKFFEEKGSKQFNAVHWYPSICVYDSHFGWTTEQHLDKEFYADFGTFDVEITLPNHYIVEATGELVNEEEVLPESLKKVLDLDNFQKARDTMSIPVKPDGSTKTWRYRAINVHNFAFIADPKLRRKEVNYNGVRVIAQVMEQNAHRWQQSAQFAKIVTQIYSEDIGMYAWPKIVVADSKDGMEYPMLTLDNGVYPNHQGLLAHEMGHMWFYGMVGSNETYRAFLDEGFTQFLTVWSLDKINGEIVDYQKYAEQSKGARKWLLSHTENPQNRYERLYYPYVKWVLEGYDHQLNTHSSDFNGCIRHGGGYGLVYYKTGVMLYNLRYVLGNELFDAAFKHYFEVWKMKHPYPEDFRKTIINFTKVDLNWFFDQWLETTKYIDYSIKEVNLKEDKVNLTLERVGEMQMPLDLVFTTSSGKKLNYYIPNTWFEKNISAQKLTKWYGWGSLNKTYDIEIDISERIEKIEIDPSLILADVDRTNNVWEKGSRIEFQHFVKNNAIWRESKHFWRPDLFYMAQDGLKVGLHFEGNYFEFLKSYQFNFGFNSHLLRYDLMDNNKNTSSVYVNFEAQERLRNIWRGLDAIQKLDFDAGMLRSTIGLSKRFREKDLQDYKTTTFQINHQTYGMFGTENSNYSLSNTYQPYQWNNFLELGGTKLYQMAKGKGSFSANLRMPGLLSDFNYGFLETEAKNNWSLGKMDLRTRLFSRLGYGNTALMSQLGISRANGEQMYQKRYTRAQGIIPQESMVSNRGFNIGYQAFGGLNVRGLHGLSDTTLAQNDFYQSGLSLNVEAGFGKFIEQKGKIAKRMNFNPYLFLDGAFAVSKERSFLPMADAGIGLETKINFGYWDVRPLILRVEMPILTIKNDQKVSSRLLLSFGQLF